MMPVLKYQGGKSREISRFLQYIPHDYNRYVEPFLGGGAVYFYLEPHNALLNDVNTPLMNFYKDLKNKYSIMKEQLDKLSELYAENRAEYVRLKAADPSAHIDNVNEALYYRMRNTLNSNNTETEYLASVIYFFINKTAYAGMVRHNRSGKFNTPFGRYAKLNTQSMMRQHSELLQSAILLNTDYSKVFDMTREEDFVFLDPPYDAVFSNYGNSADFDEHEHRRLAADFRNLHCRALMIIGETKLTKELYSGYVCGRYPVKYAINIKNRFNHSSTHLIVANFGRGC